MRVFYAEMTWGLEFFFFNNSLSEQEYTGLKWNKIGYMLIIVENGYMEGCQYTVLSTSVYIFKFT